MPSMLRLARLFISTVRHLSPWQVWARVSRRTRRWWWRWFGGPVFPPAPTLKPFLLVYPGLIEVCTTGPWIAQLNSAVINGEKVANRHFSFLNQSVAFGERVGWQDRRFSHLWRFHLHYFDYLKDLMLWALAKNSSAGFLAFRSLAEEWIAENPLPQGDGWHPYTISLRISNWLHALGAVRPQLDAHPEFRDKLFASLLQQGRVLRRDLELDLRGNHLLENLRALIALGVTLEGAEGLEWREHALGVLAVELVEQIPADGGHFERSPGYHVVMIMTLVEMGLWLRRNAGGAPVWLDEAIRRMLDYLVAILPPGGAVPLLKDTAWDAAPAPTDVLTVGALYLDQPQRKRDEHFGLLPFLCFGHDGWRKFREWPLLATEQVSVALLDSGHFVLRDDDAQEHLIFDAGKVCPDYLPGHAHADLLTFELTVGGERIVVDSGVFEYTAGPWRDFFRSTRAHNTVEVDCQNQSEVWGSFRVGRRAHPYDVRWHPTGESVWLQAAHDGYLRLPGRVRHRRTMHWQKREFWVVWDDLVGTGRFSAENHIHFQPRLGLEMVDHVTWRIHGATTPLWITAAGHETFAFVRGELAPRAQGWYSERFGERTSNGVLTLRRSGLESFGFGYVITKGEPAQLLATSQANGKFSLTVRSRGVAREISIGPLPTSVHV